MRRDVKTQAKAINAILRRDWDPIGAGAPADEYESYVWPLYRLLIDGKPREDIAAYLRGAGDDKVTVPVSEGRLNEERLNKVVDKLISLELAKTEGKRQ